PLLVLGLLLLALALESWTLMIALREIGGWRGLQQNRHNTTVLAVVLEDGVALVGIMLTLLVAGVGYFLGPHPGFDASVAIIVGIILGAMALFLAALNRRVLIDTSDEELDRAAERWLAGRNIEATGRPLILDPDRVSLIINVKPELASSYQPRQSPTGALRD